MKRSILMLINVLIFASPSFASNSEKVLEETAGGVGNATQCKEILSQNDLNQGHTQRSKGDYPKDPLIDSYRTDKDQDCLLPPVLRNMFLNQGISINDEVSSQPFINQNYLPHLEGLMDSQSDLYWIVKQGDQGSMILEEHHHLNENELDLFVDVLNNAETLSDLINRLQTNERLRDSNFMRNLEKSVVLPKK
jgi:hypothetical protein